MNKQHFKHIGWRGTLLYIISILSVVVTFAWTLEADPLVVSNVNGQPSSFKAKAGDKVTFTRQVCVSKEIDVVVDKNLFSVIDDGGTVISRPAQPTPMYHSLKPGCVVRSYHFFVPEDTIPGSYLYQPFVTYSINPIQMKHKPITPIQITVVE